MRFEATRIPGVVILDIERRTDARGYFARLWCGDELAKQGLEPRIAQINAAFSPEPGTLRGCHFQLPPDDEIKVVRVTRGAAFDVAIDLRPDSHTFRQWVGVELSAENERQLWIPRGCAHGYQTLLPDTELVYSTSAYYAPAAARGVRYDDPAFGIRWPLAVTLISDADRSWPHFVA